MWSKKKQSQARSISKWRRWGLKMGKADARKLTQSANANDQNQLFINLNRLWVRRMRYSKLLKRPLTSYQDAVKGYVRSYYKAGIIPAKDWLLLPTKKSVGVIISMDKYEHIAEKLLEELTKLPISQIICVVSGSNRMLIELIRKKSSAILVYYDEAITPEIARALGAKLSDSDVLLFLDGRSPVSAKQLLPYMIDVAKGNDVVLNEEGLESKLHQFSQRNMIQITMEFINYCLGRPEWGSSSLEQTPHVLTRKAYDVISPSNLTVPSKAYMLAMLRGLAIRPVHIKPARIQRRLRSTSQSKQVFHDQMEAMRLLIQERGNRLQFIDARRKREYAQGGQKLADNEHHHT